MQCANLGGEQRTKGGEGGVAVCRGAHTVSWLMRRSDSPSSSRGRASDTFMLRFSVLVRPPVMALFTLNPVFVPINFQAPNFVPMVTGVVQEQLAHGESKPIQSKLSLGFSRYEEERGLSSSSLSCIVYMLRYSHDSLIFCYKTRHAADSDTTYCK